MAKRVLVPVFPSERFYDAVIAAADLVAEQGGLITFLFTQTRPPPRHVDSDEEGDPSRHEVADEIEPSGDVAAVEEWQEEQVRALDDARQLVYDRGLTDAHLDYAFADVEEGAAQAIADEAAAGAYDAVVLARGYFEEMPDEDTLPEDVAEAVQELDGVSLIVS